MVNSISSEVNNPLSEAVENAVGYLILLLALGFQTTDVRVELEAFSACWLYI